MIATEMNKLGIVLLVIVVLITRHTSNAQDAITKRMELVRQFALDLRDGKPDQEIFKKYLESRGAFTDQTVSHTALEWTKMLRESLKKIQAADVEVYPYIDHPEKGVLLKPAGDDGETRYVPLEFELHTKNQAPGVDTSDLYVLKINEEKVYMLFAENNKLLSFFGLRWGHKVVLMQF
jgi:hypothetical protein